MRLATVESARATRTSYGCATNLIRSGSGPLRITAMNCARLFVAQMVELSHMISPPKKINATPSYTPHFIPKQSRKTNSEDGTAFLPSNPSCRAVRHNFLRLRPKRKKSSEASPHFIQVKNYSGFSAKKVRTSTKNVSNFAENAKSPEIASSQTTSGGRGGIPP